MAKAKAKAKKKSKDKAGAREPAPKASVARPAASKSSVAKPLARALPKSVAPLTTAAKPANPAKAGKPIPSAIKTSPTPGKANTPMTSRKPESGKQVPGKPAPVKPAPGATVPGARPAVPARAGVPGRVPLSRSAVAQRLAARDKEEAEREKNRLKKSPYSKRDLQPMRTALLAKRLQLVGAIDKLGNEALRADEPDTDSDDVADHGTDAFERNMTLGLMENEARTLQQIEEALEQMATGRYGICTLCGSAIPIARLTALPFATTCVPCQEKAERRL